MSIDNQEKNFDEIERKKNEEDTLSIVSDIRINALENNNNNNNNNGKLNRKSSFNMDNSHVDFSNFSNDIEDWNNSKVN